MTCGQQMMLGGGGATITLAASYNPSSSVTGTPAICQFSLTNAGDVRMTNPNNTVNDVGDWLVPKSNMSLYDAMMTVNSGSALAGSATATWLNLAGTVNWTLTQAVLGISGSNCTLQVRQSSSGTVLGTSSVVFSAERT